MGARYREVPRYGQTCVAYQKMDREDQHTHPLELNEEIILLLHQLGLTFFKDLSGHVIFLNLLSKLVELLFLLSQLVFRASNVEEWFHFGVEFPPLPVTQEEIFANVSLKNCNSQPTKQVLNTINVSYGYPFAHTTYLWSMSFLYIFLMR